MSSSQKPVLLIHGIDDTTRVFDAMVAYLRDRHWTEIHTLNLLPNNGDMGLDELAKQVQSYVHRRLDHVDRFDLVGFSMGGIVGRYYVQRLGGVQKVRHFMTLSSPHKGTWTGYLRQNRGAEQMRPGSFLLQDLNATVHELQHIGFTSVWTPYDLMILPANSSQLPIGNCIQVPVVAHPFMLTDERSLAVVAKTLQGERLSRGLIV